MSDEAPPTYSRDLKLLRSWKGRLFDELRLKPTPRNNQIFKDCCSLIAFAYENNRDDDVRYWS